VVVRGYPQYFHECIRKQVCAGQCSGLRLYFSGVVTYIV
jgi:hypothetical protein